MRPNGRWLADTSNTEATRRVSEQFALLEADFKRSESWMVFAGCLIVRFKSMARLLESISTLMNFESITPHLRKSQWHPAVNGHDPSMRRNGIAGRGSNLNRRLPSPVVVGVNKYRHKAR